MVDDKPARCGSRIAHEDGAVRQCMWAPHDPTQLHTDGNAVWSDDNDRVIHDPDRGSVTWAEAADLALAVMAEQDARRAELTDREAALSLDDVTMRYTKEDLDTAHERGIAEGRAERDRLRTRIHEVASNEQKRSGKLESELTKLRGLMAQALRNHNDEMVRIGNQPGTYISGYGQAAAALIIGERDAASARVAELELLLEQAEQYARDLQDGTAPGLDERLEEVRAEGRHQATEGWEREWGLILHGHPQCVMNEHAARGIAADPRAGVEATVVSRLVGPWEPAEQRVPAEGENHGDH